MNTDSEPSTLPVFGVGPAYVAGIFTLTILAGLATYLGWIAKAAVTPRWLRIVFITAGVLTAIAGITIWCLAVIGARSVAKIKNNQLMTDGIYAWVRHPVYAAFLFINTGILLTLGNYWLLILPFVYWISLSVLMKYTEERWLTRHYGQRYLDYAQHVNRVIPWPPT